MVEPLKIVAPSGADMLAYSHWLIFLAGAFFLGSVLIGLATRKIGAPVLLVFLVIGMVASHFGGDQIAYVNFRNAYLFGGVALAVILFEGGLQVRRDMVRLALAPGFLLATLGVAVTALVVALVTYQITNASVLGALLVGAVLAPTDAAAVAALLRSARLALPARLNGILEIESGLNDPMAVMLTLLISVGLVTTGHVSVSQIAVGFGVEMGGGLGFGLLGGGFLLLVSRTLPIETHALPVIALAVIMTLFGGAQIVGASGFLACYVVGAIIGMNDHDERAELIYFFETLSWLGQVMLFLMLGLLFPGHDLLRLAPRAVCIAAALMFLARPAAAFLCLLPFRVPFKEVVFASWVGLRGAVPIYLVTIPVLLGFSHGPILFSATLVIVCSSLIVQGWTIAPVGRLLGFGKK